MDLPLKIMHIYVIYDFAHQLSLARRFIVQINYHHLSNDFSPVFIFMYHQEHKIPIRLALKTYIKLLTSETWSPFFFLVEMKYSLSIKNIITPEGRRKKSTDLHEHHNIRYVSNILFPIRGIRGMIRYSLGLDFPFVEAPVAAAGSTSKCAACPLLPSGHELSTTINSIPSNMSCMIFLALSVSHTS